MLPRETIFGKVRHNPFGLWRFHLIHTIREHQLINTPDVCIVEPLTTHQGFPDVSLAYAYSSAAQDD
jgi:hypothetical protein